MDVLLENCLTVDHTNPAYTISPVRQVSPFLIDEDSGLGMEMVGDNNFYNEILPWWFFVKENYI